MSVAASDLHRSVAVSVLTCVLGTGLAVAVNFATDDGAGLTPWLAVVALTLLSAVLALLARPRRTPVGGQPPPPPGYGHGYGDGAGQQAWWPAPPPRPRRTVSWLAAVLVIALIAGGAGTVAYTGWYGVNWLTGNEPGTDVLAGEASATVGPLTLTVHRVEVTRHFTKIELTAVNRGSSPIGLPLFGYCQLDAGGTTLGPSPHRSDWTDNVPPGGQVRGTITFGGRPAQGAQAVTLSFASVFAMDVESITIRDIPVRPAPQG